MSRYFEPLDNEAMCFFFKDMVKARVRTFIMEEAEWPRMEVNVADRESRITEVELEIAELQLQRDSLLSEFGEIGVSIGAIHRAALEGATVIR